MKQWIHNKIKQWLRPYVEEILKEGVPDVHLIIAKPRSYGTSGRSGSSGTSPMPPDKERFTVDGHGGTWG